MPKKTKVTKRGLEPSGAYPYGLICISEKQLWDEIGKAFDKSGVTDLYDGEAIKYVQVMGQVLADYVANPQDLREMSVNELSEYGTRCLDMLDQYHAELNRRSLR